MAGTSEGGKKAAKARGRESLREAGRKGGQHSHGGGRQANNARGSKREEDKK